MATDNEREIFESMILNSVGRDAINLPAIDVTGFLAMAGRAWSGELMVVGRAVNGWTNGVLPDCFAIPSEASKFAKLVQDSVAGDDRCPMSWVTDHWGENTQGYNTKRSAFWRSIRSVVKQLGIADVENTSWSSQLVWSNLYKISPSIGGNPNNTLCDIQFSGCSQLLNLELATYCPTRVLFLTGANWADPFLKGWEQRGSDKFSYVERFGIYGNTRYVVAVHPQGKPEEQWVNEVISAFNC